MAQRLMGKMLMLRQADFSHTLQGPFVQWT
jgi:hypothetical protein